MINMTYLYSFSGRSIAALVLALLVPAGLWAQPTQGRISGLVKDPTGAVIPGATVTVERQDTGLIFTAKSQGDGGYLVPNLLSATYQVSGEAKGFKRLTISGLKLDAGTTLTQDLVLQVGVATETVTVTGTSSLVETNTNAVGTTIDAAHMTELPLADRQLFALMNLTPGTFFTRIADNPT
jgi:hypothetical protein